MNLCQRLAASFKERAEGVTVDLVSIGLGYTAVRTSDGGVGLSFTFAGTGPACTKLDLEGPLEGRPASDLLGLLCSLPPLHKGLGLATLNALNHAFALSLPEDRDNATLFELLEIRQGTRLAMVGCIAPLVAKLRKAGVEVEVIDEGKGIGQADRFEESLHDWAEVIIMTSTSLLNDSAEAILAMAGPDVRCAFLGPSTPLAAEPFADLPVRVLAGTVPVDLEATFQAVRHGRGTPVLQRFARKPYLEVPGTRVP